MGDQPRRESQESSENLNDRVIGKSPPSFAAPRRATSRCSPPVTSQTRSRSVPGYPCAQRPVLTGEIRSSAGRAEPRRVSPPADAGAEAPGPPIEPKLAC